MISSITEALHKIFFNTQVELTGIELESCIRGVFLSIIIRTGDVK